MVSGMATLKSISPAVTKRAGPYEPVASADCARRKGAPNPAAPVAEIRLA